VWIDHLHTNCPALRRLLDNDLVGCHPLVIGEIACGNMRHRAEVLEALAVLPTTPTIDYVELLAFLETHKLFSEDSLVAQATSWESEGKPALCLCRWFGKIDRARRRFIRPGRHPPDRNCVAQEWRKRHRTHIIRSSSTL